jgi:hypothetical protein
VSHWRPIAQLVIGRSAFSGDFDPHSGTGGRAADSRRAPAGIDGFHRQPLLTLVWEGWPLKRMHRLPAGIYRPGALSALSWGAALAVDYVAYDFPAPPESGLTSQSGPFSGEEISALLALCGSWQVWIFLVWRGWPLHSLRRRWLRIVLGNLLVIGGTALTYAIVRGLAAVDLPVVIAIAAGFNSAGLVVVLLFERVFRSRRAPAWERVATFLSTAVGGVLLFVVLLAYAETLTWSTAGAAAWVGHVCVNAVASR